MERKQAFSFWLFLFSLFIYAGSYGAAWYLSKNHADPKFAMYLVMSCFIACLLSAVGITLALTIDKKRNTSLVFRLTGLIGNVIIVLIFLAFMIMAIRIRN